MTARLNPIKDKQTTTPDGQLVINWIDGVKIRYATTIPDERGTVCEVYNPAWDFDDAPIVFIYQFTVRPHKIKGWGVHREHEDRYFVSLGSLKVVLYDGREESPTFGLINEIVLSDQNRALLRIPRGVYHADQNVGETDALVINMPTIPYDHTNPDKYRLIPTRSHINSILARGGSPGQRICEISVPK